MRHYKLYFIAILFPILFNTCKKKDVTGDEIMQSDIIKKVCTLLNTQNGAAIKYKEIFLAGKDPLEALIGMGKWLIEQPDVGEAYIFDDCIVEVHFKNGLKSHIKVVEVDANGIHRNRGGSGIKLYKGQKSSQLQFGLMHSGLTSLDGNHIIGNNKVLVFIPFYKEFYNSSYLMLPKFEGGGQKLDVTLLTDTKADLKAINSFADYGFIIINSHGLINGFVIRPKVDILKIPAAPEGNVFTDDMARQMFTKENDLPLDKIENGELVLDLEIIRNYDGTVLLRDYHVLVTENYIRNIPHLKDAVVFGNHCYSGYTADGPNKNNMPEAFKSIGAISYYGYSFADGKSDTVNNEFAMSMEDSLITGLVKNRDSTGIAHLKNNFIAQFQTTHTRSRSLVSKISPDLTKASYMQQRPQVTDNLYFSHYFDNSFKYYGCGSFTDVRDGNIYTIACIGEQSWMRENLRYNAPGSTCYPGADCERYGRLYEWTTLMNGSLASKTNPSGVKGLCPIGWHLPSESEWSQLILSPSVGGINSGGNLKAVTDWKSPNTGATDKLGFTALPGGKYDALYKKYELFTERGYWWSSTEYSSVPGTYKYMMLYHDRGLVVYNPAERPDNQYSCRCLKDN